MSLRFILPVFIAAILVVVPAPGRCQPNGRNTVQPLHRLTESEKFALSDDFDLSSLAQAAQHQAAWLRRQDPSRKIRFGEDRYDNRWLLLSVEQLLTALRQNPSKEELYRFLQENYLIYQAAGRSDATDRRMLVTGYYEPIFPGSLTPRAPYLYPIYRLPKSLVVLSGADGRKRIGRYTPDHTFVKFWSRAEIENNRLLQGDELAFLKDPVDAFLLQVQGSGRIRLPDNSIKAVRFAGSNGLEYKSIGKLLVDEGRMVLEEVNIPAIRDYLIKHPDQQRRILQYNPRMIFFSWGDSRPPKGSSGEILTPGRSIATDRTVLPPGAIGYLTTRRPEISPDGTTTGWTPLHRLVFPQDAGAAIQGTGRVDIFWGSGNYAEAAANNMKEAGYLFFLVKRGYPNS